MKAFMDKEFMLQSPVAQHLYHTYAADMPICDYHCHISPKEIYENRRFENIAQVWLGGRNPDGSYFGDQGANNSIFRCLIIVSRLYQTALIFITRSIKFIAYRQHHFPTIIVINLQRRCRGYKVLLGG